jgi:hypothetical protein
MPKNAFDFPSTEREERWGLAKYIADWEGRQTSEELRRLTYFCDPLKVYAPLDEATYTVDSQLEDWVYQGPAMESHQAEANRKRALKRQRQLAAVRKQLWLLEKYGPGEPLQPGIFDPLEPLPNDRDDQFALGQARGQYWTMRRQALPDASLAAITPPTGRTNVVPIEPDRRSAPPVPLDISRRTSGQPGRREVYDWPGLKGPLTDHVRGKGQFGAIVDLVRWCVDNVKLKSNARRPRGTAIDLKNAKAAIIKHGLDKIGLDGPEQSSGPNGVIN